MRRRFVESFVQRSAALDAAYRRVADADREALGRLSRQSLDELILVSPWVHRARTKPLGYPGDYEMMNGVYARSPSAPTLFASAVDEAFLSTPGAEAVRARKDLVKAIVRGRLAERSGDGRPLRVLSVASGPAEETFELLQESGELPRPMEIVLFDQDAGALEHCRRRLEPLLVGREVKITYVCDSVVRLPRDPGLQLGSAPFEVIISVGLCDYLQRRTAASLVRTFHERLTSGGTAYVGNMVPDCPSRWFMELLLDWHLLYRTRQEMLDFASRGAPAARLEIVEEATGWNPLVAIHRG